MLIMQILAALGVGIVIYAVIGIFTPSNPQPSLKSRMSGQPLPEQDDGKERKIQRLQSQVTELETELEQARVVSAEEKTALTDIKEKEAEFSAELKRREEWVAKAEAELAKAKAENLDLNNKFLAKEHDLQEEFTKNVNLDRQVREIKAALEAAETANRLKEDQLQAQKHQNESQLKSLNESSAVIAEFNRKEKISEWVPKQEFNQLNEQCLKLEKDLEASQEKLKNLAAEITHLRKLVLPVGEIKIVEKDMAQEIEEVDKPEEPK